MPVAKVVFWPLTVDFSTPTPADNSPTPAASPPAEGGADFTALSQRVEILERSSSLLARSDEAQRNIIAQLQADKQKALQESASAKNRADRFDRLVKVVLLSLVFSIFVFDGRIGTNPGTGHMDFELKTKEVPLSIGGVYGLAVLSLVLDKQQIGTIVDAMKQLFLGREPPAG